MRMLALKSDNDGETGIGQMILFIAMILVSAVAAGLFIQTVSDLREQARETGEQTMIDVSTGLTVVSATGDRNQDGTGSPSDYLEEIEIMVKLSAGSKPVDIENVVVVLTTTDSRAELAYASSADASHFSAEEVRDPEETWSATKHVLSTGGLVKITIDPDYAELDMQIGAGEEIEIRMVPLHGSTCIIRKTTPSVFVDRFVNLS